MIEERDLEGSNPRQRQITEPRVVSLGLAAGLDLLVIARQITLELIEKSELSASHVQPQDPRRLLTHDSAQTKINELISNPFDELTSDTSAHPSRIHAEISSNSVSPGSISTTPIAITPIDKGASHIETAWSSPAALVAVLRDISDLPTQWRISPMGAGDQVQLGIAGLIVRIGQGYLTDAITASGRDIARAQPSSITLSLGGQTQLSSTASSGMSLDDDSRLRATRADAEHLTPSATLNQVAQSAQYSIIGMSTDSSSFTTALSASSKTLSYTAIAAQLVSIPRAPQILSALALSGGFADQLSPQTTVGLPLISGVSTSSQASVSAVSTDVDSGNIARVYSLIGTNAQAPFSVRNYISPADQTGLTQIVSPPFAAASFAGPSIPVTPHSIITTSIESIISKLAPLLALNVPHQLDAPTMLIPATKIVEGPSVSAQLTQASINVLPLPGSTSPMADALHSVQSTPSTILPSQTFFVRGQIDTAALTCTNGQSSSSTAISDVAIVPASTSLPLPDAHIRTVAPAAIVVFHTALPVLTIPPSASVVSVPAVQGEATVSSSLKWLSTTTQNIPLLSSTQISTITPSVEAAPIALLTLPSAPVSNVSIFSAGQVSFIIRPSLTTQSLPLSSSTPVTSITPSAEVAPTPSPTSPTAPLTPASTAPATQGNPTVLGSISVPPSVTQAELLSTASPVASYALPAETAHSLPASPITALAPVVVIALDHGNATVPSATGATLTTMQNEPLSTSTPVILITPSAGTAHSTLSGLATALLGPADNVPASPFGDTGAASVISVATHVAPIGPGHFASSPSPLVVTMLLDATQHNLSGLTYPTPNHNPASREGVTLQAGEGILPTRVISMDSTHAVDAFTDSSHTLTVPLLFLHAVSADIPAGVASGTVHSQETSVSLINSGLPTAPPERGQFITLSTFDPGEVAKLQINAASVHSHWTANADPASDPPETINVKAVLHEVGLSSSNSGSTISTKPSYGHMPNPAIIYTDIELDKPEDWVTKFLDTPYRLKLGGCIENTNHVSLSPTAIPYKIIAEIPYQTLGTGVSNSVASALLRHIEGDNHPGTVLGVSQTSELQPCVGALDHEPNGLDLHHGVQVDHEGSSHAREGNQNNGEVIHHVSPGEHQSASLWIDHHGL